MSMWKTFSPSDWAQLEEPATVIKAGSRGLRGNDLSAFIKRAGDEAASRFAALEKHPGERYIHQVAMGATEIISPNRNADGWKQAILIACHPTFVKFAHWYRNHQLDRPFYGKVRDSWYNHKMGRVELLTGLFATKQAAEAYNPKRAQVADKELMMLEMGRDVPVSMSGLVPYDTCFKAGTLVETETGMRPIEQIRKGDLVRTHTGAMKPVTRVLTRAYAGTFVDMTVMGVPETITSTAEHPFLAVKKASLRSCYGSVRNRNGKQAKRRHSFRNNSTTCVGCKKPLQLQRDWEAAQDIRVGDYLTCPMVQPGQFEYGQAKSYLLGLYIGDGSLIKKTRTRAKLVEDVADGVQISLGNDHPETLQLARQRVEEASLDHCRDYPEKDKAARVLCVRDTDFGTDAQFLVGMYSDGKILNEEVFSFCKEDRLALLAGWVDSDGCADHLHRAGTIRITTVNRTLAEQCKRLVNGLGYNASIVVVPTSKQSFASSEVCYHVSCGRDLWAALSSLSTKTKGLNFGRSTSATVAVDSYTHMLVQEVRHYYDECDVFNLSVEDDESYIVHGVAVHNCSGCNHKAKGRENYCRGDVCKYGGLYHNAGRVFEDGHHLHADNPYTKFIDMSAIINEDTLQPDWQADRVAYVLGEMKSASAQVLDRLGPQTVPLDMYEGSQWATKQAKTLQQLIEHEKQPGFTYHGSALPQNHPVGLKSASTQALLQQLAKQGVCLSLRDFGTLCEASPETIDSAGLSAKTAFHRLSRDYALDELLNNNLFKFAHCGCELPREALFSIAPNAVRKRAWLNVGSENAQQNQPVESESGEALADLHALYRLGFAASLEKTPELGLHLSTLARQNLSQ